VSFCAFRVLMTRSFFDDVTLFGSKILFIKINIKSKDKNFLVFFLHMQGIIGK